ncbi:MAG: thiamine diphosphokinase [Clostridiaceae bacterium]|nr:thiamine diphosphokinase [Clostridiaceae bacterium]
MTAIVVCNGSICDYSYYKKYFEDAKFVVCADGGASHLKKFGIKPDILLGDFDSINQEDLDYYKALNVEVLKYGFDKDFTDTEIAVDIVIERGFDNIVIIGGTGTRLDHSLANIFLLKKIMDKGIKGRIVNEQNEIFIASGNIRLEREEGFKITLLPLTQKVTGITTKGLLYPLKDDCLVMGEGRGVSNEFADSYAEVSTKSGILMVIKSKD